MKSISSDMIDIHFEDKLSNVVACNMHPSLLKIYNKLPASLSDFPNLLFYGPSGSGKYSQMLYAISKYSPSKLKYEKKINMSIMCKTKTVPIVIKISDIHFEINMSFLGCFSKILWHEIYQQISDTIAAKTDKIGIIVCTHFQEIHRELLENFYSYMQDNGPSTVNIKYIILSTSISFIPSTILNCCEIIRVPKPKNTNKTSNTTNTTNTTKITTSLEPFCPHKFICEKIIYYIIDYSKLQYLEFRYLLYDILTYNLNVYDCIWYIITNLIYSKHITSAHMNDITRHTYTFLKYYNNNYRPIFHLESYMFHIITSIHSLKCDTLHTQPTIK